MNLPDLINRKDRAVVLKSGAVTARKVGIPGQRSQRGVELTVGAALCLRDAHQFSVLSTLPKTLDWRISRDADHEGGLRIQLVMQQTADTAALADVILPPSAHEAPILLDWPAIAGDGPFDLVLEQTGETPTLLSVGPLIDSKTKLRPFLRGKGVEVGPGPFPQVLPGEDVDVEYVEQKSPDDWQTFYGKGAASTELLTPEVMARYRIGSGTTLEEWAPESLDFIFSNHVFEHLVNPAQVLRNWFGRLKAGGVVLGVVPDARFSFDLRQPFSRREDFERQLEAGSFEVPDAAYEAWSRYTAPDTTPASLKARGYSVHIHYSTPALFIELAGFLGVRGEDYTLFLETTPNNKDFGFILRKLR